MKIYIVVAEARGMAYSGADILIHKICSNGFKTTEEAHKFLPEFRKTTYQIVLKDINLMDYEWKLCNVNPYVQEIEIEENG